MRIGIKLGIAIAAIPVLLAMSAGRSVADVREGDRALSQGRLDAALEQYEAVARSGNAAAQAGIGRVWLKRNQYDRAMAAFKRAAELDPSLAWAHYGQGEVLSRQDKCEEAIPLLRKAISLDRKFPEAQLALGNCLVALGRIDEGIADLNRGMNWGKQWTPRFLVARGTAQMARDSLRAAGVDFTRAREMAPRDPEVRTAIGDFYLRRGTWALAIPEYEAAMSLDPTGVEAQYALSQALYYDQRYDESLAAYRKVMEIDPNYAPGLLGLGDLLYRAGAADPRRYAESREALEKYTMLEPADGKGWSLLGRTYYHLGSRDSALALLEKGESLGDRSKEMYTAMGRVYADQKQWDRALAALEKGQTGPKEWGLLAQIYEMTGHPDRADSMYTAILAKDSTSATATFALSQRARLRYRQKDFAGARELFDRVVALDPKNGEAYFYRGLSLKELGQPDEAIASLERAAAIDSNKADRFFWLGVLYDTRKRTDEAEQAFRKAIAADPQGDLAGKSYRQLGFYRLLKKQWKAAIDQLEQAVKLDPKDAQAWLWLGQGYQNAGNRPKAAAAYRRVLELDPQNMQAKKGLQAVQGTAVSRK